MQTSRSLKALATFFVVAGLLHFVVPGFYLKIVPPWISDAKFAVYVSGVLEVLGGIGVLIPAVRKLAGFGLIALLIVIFPANIEMARQAFQRDAPFWELLVLTGIRLPLQGVLIWWVWSATVRGKTGPIR